MTPNHPRNPNGVESLSLPLLAPTRLQLNQQVFEVLVNVLLNALCRLLANVAIHVERVTHVEAIARNNGFGAILAEPVPAAGPADTEHFLRNGAATGETQRIRVRCDVNVVVVTRNFRGVIRSRYADAVLDEEPSATAVRLLKQTVRD